MGTFIGIESEINYDRDYTRHYLTDPKIVREISIRGGIPIVLPTPITKGMSSILNICDAFVKLDGSIVVRNEEYVVHGDNPVIGIITTPDYDANRNPQFLADPRLIKWVYACGGTPIIIVPPRDVSYHTQGGPPTMTSDEVEKLNKILDLCDGFIKPGGYTLTDYHKYIYNYSVENDVPYLGICAGIQLMAFCVEDEPKLVLNDNQSLHKVKGGAIHPVIITPNSKLFKVLVHGALEPDIIPVKSSHIKHIEGVSKLLIAALSEDGQVEALENPNCTYNLGLQFHPEAYDPYWRHDKNYKYSKRIFESFIDSAKDYKYKKQNVK